MNQRPSIDNQDREWLPARDAAELLGIKKETLYAYASRGLVRSVAGPGADRGRLYHREDLERLQARSRARAGHGAVAAGALRWGEPVLETRVGTIGESGPAYRGTPAIDLVRRGVSFEEVCALLWDGPFVDPQERGLGVHGPSLHAVLPSNAGPFEAMLLVAAALAAAEPRGEGLEVTKRRAGALVRRLVASCALPRGMDAVNAALGAGMSSAASMRSDTRTRVASGRTRRGRAQSEAGSGRSNGRGRQGSRVERTRGEGARVESTRAGDTRGGSVRRASALEDVDGDPGAERVYATARSLLVALGARTTATTVEAMNEALVLSADHELNVSTFAARVAASSGANLPASILAALAALSGPLHGAATARVEALVAETERPERAAEVVAARLDRGESVPGFGHPLYPDGDPRGARLLEIAQRVSNKPRAVRVLVSITNAMHLVAREQPTIDVGLTALASALGLPRGAPLAIFACGRLAGWIAHALEQRDAGHLLRPRARYVGARGGGA